MAKLHDKQYVIPVIQEVTAININKAMFKDAGLVDENGVHWFQRHGMMFMNLLRN